MIAVFSFAIVGYANFLHFLEDQEQQQLKEAQGQYYYSETFDDVLFEPYDDMITFDVTEENKDKTFYEKIRKYNYLHK